MKKIVLTGGGSAGHVTPHLALLPHLLKEGYEVHYIGTQDGIEHGMVGNLLGVTTMWSNPASCAATLTGRTSPIPSA